MSDVWVVIEGQDWPRRVERVCSSEDAATRFADAMNMGASPGLWWVEKWSVSP